MSSTQIKNVVYLNLIILALFPTVCILITPRYLLFVGEENIIIFIFVLHGLLILCHTRGCLGIAIEKYNNKSILNK